MSGRTSGASGLAPGIQKKSLQTRNSSFNLAPTITKVEEKPKLEINTKGQKAALVSEKKGKQTKVASKSTSSKADAANKGKPQYDKAATQKFDDMLDGDMTDLPPLPKTMVKIFLSSTFSDMRAERNKLARLVYPVLREFCADQGLDFQVVDMRWGVTEDSQNDHSVEKLCLLEVQNCQKASLGPNFVVISGDRYGFRPIPTEIEVEEFSVVRAEAARLGLPDQGLLDDWYKLDTNCIPNMYLLQPIRSKFTFFADDSPGCEEPRKKDTAEWWKTFEKLQTTLRTSADQAFKQKKLSAQQRHQYFCSVTECEIQEGILKPQNVYDHCLVYKRELLHLFKEALTSENATRFVDVVQTPEGPILDEEVSKLREDLIFKTVAARPHAPLITKYKLPWRPGGVDPDAGTDHREYLERFCRDFVSACQRQVTAAVEQKRSLIMMRNYYSDYEDTIHHLRFCQDKCQSFCGQEKVINSAKAYILDDSSRSPLIIHGASGAGKTSITAMIMQLIPKWLKGAEHVKLIRFLGTSPQSNNIYDVLYSVVGQLSDACDIILSPISYKNMKNLVEFFPRFLRQVANTLKQPVIIVLDSIDQLNQTNGAFGMEWLPTLLTQNVKVILSTITEHQGILTNLKQRLPDEKCYVAVPVLPESTGKLIVETYLKNDKRTITEPQMKLLLSVFKESPSPLFLKLLVDEAKKWKSYTSLSAVRLASTVKAAINALFENLENKFGSLLISHALGYITLGITGLTEFEIEDVLSCDDAVLNEVYKYHDPPIPGMVHIPPVLWARIRYDIKEYLTERLSYGRTTLFWYHRQFIETASERYTSKGKDVELHRNLTEIYLQDSGVRRTITLKNRKNLTVTDADRDVRPLPFTTQNRRKLVCLPYHAMKAQSALGSNVVKAKVFCNLKFLTTKIAAFSVASVISSLKDFLDEKQDAEISDLLNFLVSSKNDLSVPACLAVCLLSNLNPSDNQPNLKALQQEARALLDQQKKPLLVPAFPCLAPRRNLSSAPSTSIQGLTNILAASTEALLLKNHKSSHTSEEAKSELAILDTTTQDLQQVDLPDQAKSLHPDNTFVVDRDCIYCTTKTSFVKYSYRSNTTQETKFSDLVADWKQDQLVQHFCLSPDSSSALLVFKGYILLVDLSSMKCKQRYATGKKLTELETAAFMSYDEEVEIVAAGTIRNSDDADDSQGPENQKFVCIFSGASSKILEAEAFASTDDKFSSETMFFVGSNSSRIAFTMTEDDGAKGDDASNAEATHNSKLVVFELSPLAQAKTLDIPGTVKMAAGDPVKARVVVLTKEGVFYIVDVVGNQIMAQKEINQAICMFNMVWEEDVCLLSSVSGLVTLYDVKGDKNLGAFTATSKKPMDTKLCDTQFVFLDTNNELKSWSVQTLLEDAKNKDKLQVSDKLSQDHLLDQTGVSCVGVSVDGHEVFTFTKEENLNVWDLDSLKLLRQYKIGLTVNEMIVFSDGTLALLDTVKGQLTILDPETGSYPVPQSSMPTSVVAMTTNAEKNLLFIVSSPRKDHLHVDTFSTQFGKISKSFKLQKPLPHTSVDLALSTAERYLVLQTGITEEEYEAIQTLTKKSGSFPVQPHLWKFTAVDLSQGSGSVIPCFRRLSKIPTLGTRIAAYTGNQMMMCTRRWVGLWDIPTGNSDTKPCKAPYKHRGRFYRPGWVGEECKGTSYALAMAPNSKFIVVGSEDGYMFVYDTESGLPRGNAKPATKHNSDVYMVAISPDSQWVVSTCRGSILKLWDSDMVYMVAISPDSQWVVSTCRGSILKLWDSDTGHEQFSFRLDSNVQRMVFSPDSCTLVLYTGTHTTRVLVFTLQKKSGVSAVSGESGDAGGGKDEDVGSKGSKKSKRAVP